MIDICICIKMRIKGEPQWNNHERRDVTEQEKYQDEADEFDEAMIVRFVRLQDTYRDRNHIEEVEFNRSVYFLSTLFAEKNKSDDDEEVDVVVVKVVVDEGVFSESVYEEEEYEEEALLIWFFTEMNTQSTNIIKLIFLVESTSLSLDI